MNKKNKQISRGQNKKKDSRAFFRASLPEKKPKDNWFLLKSFINTFKYVDSTDATSVAISESLPQGPER